MKQLEAKVRLNLPRKSYKIVLEYNTYEKVTFDKFILANVLMKTKNKDEIDEYINDLTGSGSLNSYFKKIIQELIDKDDEDLLRIVNDSLYPIIKIDRGNQFVFYPLLNISNIRNEIITGNLCDNEDYLTNALLPKNVTFKRIDFEEIDQNSNKSNSDVYDISISENQIFIKMVDKKFYEISKENFDDIYKNDLDNELEYNGKICTFFPDDVDNWISLDKNTFNLFNDTEHNKRFFPYFNNNKNLFMIYPEFLKEIKIIKIFSMYFYKEKKYLYIKENINFVEQAISHLFDTNAINEIKTKILLSLIQCCSDLTAQKVINYVLTQKDSKEISLTGLELIKKGITKGWNETTLITIKKFIPITASIELSYIYQLSKSIKWTDEELLLIDKKILNPIDMKRRNNYQENIINIKKQINQMLGEMDSSGIREEMKKLPQKDSIYRKVQDFYNKIKAHNRINLDTLSYEKVNEKFHFVKSIFEGVYNIIKIRCEKNKR
ncbi:hypothetical protein [[Mycoplasma] testudinis]|uniref:hypothetical protein n=1 Tax=[Mycoplasma] testudinis TaxID=33924 RepID=UPI000483A35C|nr:hypothetical protein [[Mycoplasma] testudinis]